MLVCKALHGRVSGCSISAFIYTHTHDLKTVLRSYSTQTQSITFWTWLDFVANLAQLTPPCKHINMHSLAITCRG